jgi:hypothetical protein
MVFLVLVFPKNAQPNLTMEQEKACRLLAKQIAESLGQASSKERKS